MTPLRRRTLDVDARASIRTPEQNILFSSGRGRPIATSYIDVAIGRNLTTTSGLPFLMVKAIGEAYNYACLVRETNFRAGKSFLKSFLFLSLPKPYQLTFSFHPLSTSQYIRSHIHQSVQRNLFVNHDKSNNQPEGQRKNERLVPLSLFCNFLLLLLLICPLVFLPALLLIEFQVSGIFRC